MLIKPMPTEMVYQITHEEQRKILKNHFNLLYITLGESQLIPEAAFEQTNGIQRCLSGIPVPFHNAVLGCPKESLWNSCIEEQIHYFNEANMPFVWYVDEESSFEFKEKLLAHGFQDGGVFRGVIGILDKSFSSAQAPKGCTLELVKDEVTMNEFNELVCSTFGFEGTSKGLFKQAMWDAINSDQHPMFHWIAKKDGKVVSALSTLIHGNVVSFWNGASLPEVRRQGISTALRHLALEDAISKGCNIGISYLMSEGLAFGICSKLGYQTRWHFRVFLSPPKQNSIKDAQS